MSESLPHEPEEPEEPATPPRPAAPPPAVERADWLVGPEDGFSSEAERGAGPPSAQIPLPRLVRPADPNAGTPHPNTRGPAPFPGRAPLPAPVQPPPNMPSWDRGGSSVPMMPRPTPSGAMPRPAIPEAARDFPMDDAEERARVAAQVAEQQAREAAIMARPHEVVKPQEFEIPETPLPWWSQLPQLMRFDRRVQLGVLSLVLVLSVATLWPRAEKTISVAHLKRHPEQYADVMVRVGGRVGEVFPVGGSWAYTLVQGRDTIVVFSRSRVPRQRQHLVVVGTLSTGYLDGQSRVAIFESTH